MFVTLSAKSQQHSPGAGKTNYPLFLQSSLCMILILRPFRNILKPRHSCLPGSHFVPRIPYPWRSRSTNSSTACGLMSEMPLVHCTGWHGFLRTAESTRNKASKLSSLPTDLMSLSQNPTELTPFGSFGMRSASRPKQPPDQSLMSCTKCTVCGGVQPMQSPNNTCSSLQF